MKPALRELVSLTEVRLEWGEGRRLQEPGGPVA